MWSLLSCYLLDDKHSENSDVTKRSDHYYNSLSVFLLRRGNIFLYFLMFRPYKNYLCEILTAIVCNFSRIFRLVAMTMIKAALYLSSHNINIILAINVFLQCSPYFILSFFPSRRILYSVALQAPSDMHLVHHDEKEISIAPNFSRYNSGPSMHM